MEFGDVTLMVMYGFEPFSNMRSPLPFLLIVVRGGDPDRNVRLPQDSCGYNVTYHYQRVND